MTREKRYIWIIGASSGIGAALATELASRGHTLALSARSEAGLQEVASQLAGDDHLHLSCDVTSTEDLKATFDTIKQAWPRLDSMIFMAGVYQPAEVGTLGNQTTRYIITVNLLGAIQAVETILPFLRDEQRSGQIALCASVAGYRGLPKSQPYGATKAGLINYTETLRAEVGDQLDIRLINPGFVKTRLTEKNNFSMPMIVTTEVAAKNIADGLESRAFEISFPWRFVVFLKFMRILPSSIYFWLLRRIL